MVVREFGRIDNVALEGRPDPVPAPGEVLVRVGAVAANFVDTLVIGGTYQFLPERPFTPGKGPAGTVMALGAGVTALAVGERVLAMAEIGDYTELAVAPAAQCYARGDPFDAALRALAWRGRLVVIGFAAGRIPSVKANYLLVKNIEVSGLQISDYRKRMPELARRCFEEIFSLYETGQLHAPPFRTYPLSQAREALGALLDRRVRERIVMLPGGG